MQTLDLLFVSTMDCKGRGTNAIHRCLPLCPCITQYFRYITSYLSQILILMYTQQRIVFVNTNQQKIGRLPVLYAFPQYVKKGCLIKCPRNNKKYAKMITAKMGYTKRQQKIPMCCSPIAPTNTILQSKKKPFFCLPIFFSCKSR